MKGYFLVEMIYKPLYTTLNRKFFCFIFVTLINEDSHCFCVSDQNLLITFCMKIQSMAYHYNQAVKVYSPQHVMTEN